MIEPLPGADYVVLTDAQGASVVVSVEEILSYARPLVEAEQERKAEAARDFHTRCAISRTTFLDQ